MEIVLFSIGKTNKMYAQEMILEYKKRLNKYTKFVVNEIRLSSKKINSKSELLKRESNLFLNHITDKDYVILLDENGTNYTSINFAQKVEKLRILHKRIIFLIGGVYGFSEILHKKSNEKMSLSRMTFSHQMAKIFFIEQLYRAFTILNHHPYHNE